MGTFLDEQPLFLIKLVTAVQNVLCLKFSVVVLTWNNSRVLVLLHIRLFTGVTERS